MPYSYSIPHQSFMNGIFFSQLLYLLSSWTKMYKEQNMVICSWTYTTKERILCYCLQTNYYGYTFSSKKRQNQIKNKIILFPKLVIIFGYSSFTHCCNSPPSHANIMCFRHALLSHANITRFHHTFLSISENISIWRWVVLRNCTTIIIIYIILNFKRLKD